MEDSFSLIFFKIAFAILFIGFAVYISRPFEASNCKRNRFFSSDEFNGMVISKKRNVPGNYEEVKLSNGDIFSWEDDFFGGDSYLIYDSIQIGDSIIKKDSELIITVFRQDALFVLDLELPCDE